jgi:putative restriction endonuclease
MPTVGPRELVDAVLSAVHASGHSAVLLSPVRDHPRKFAVTLDASEALSLWVYIWTLTHGGRPSLPNEYRIQMTSVSSPLSVNPKGYMVLLGYEQDLGLFAGFDIERHGIFTMGSPLVQIDIRTVQAALQDGFAFDRKSNSEIAIGFRPDQFINYVINARQLHVVGRQLKTFELLTRASSLQDIPAGELAQLPRSRQRIIQEISRLSRDANFRQQVLQAYDNRCAVSRAQLKLVDAAHILPVGSPDSLDMVYNGLALSPTYHRAFDRGLVYLTPDYEMKMNPAMEDELRRLNLAGGIQTFKAALGQIFLPPDPRQRPRRELIVKANRFRLIAEQ